jgi:hypothetical protein
VCAGHAAVHRSPRMNGAPADVPGRVAVRLIPPR